MLADIEVLVICGGRRLISKSFDEWFCWFLITWVTVLLVELPILSIGLSAVVDLVEEKVL